MNARTFAVALLPVLFAVACAGPQAALRTEAHLFDDGGGSTARVVRTISPSGAEALHGETDFAGGIHVTEDATLDTDGRLVRAEVVLRRGARGPLLDSFVVDRERGVVRVAAAGGPVEWPVPVDAPWAPAPPRRGVTTPITAWILARAADDASSVRMIQLDTRSSYRAPAEQLAIETERGTTLVLGDDVAEAGATFVERVKPAKRAAMARVSGAPRLAEPTSTSSRRPG